MNTTETAPPPPAAAEPHGRRLLTILSSKGFQGSITFLAFLAVFAVFSVWLGSQFFSVDARFLDIHQSTPVLLLGLAVLVTLIAGQFDLSVASMATLTTFLAIGLKIDQDWPFALVLVACLAIGVIGGLINGLLVVGLRVNTFIATLGTGGVFVGLSSVYSGGTQLSPTPDTHPLPSWFTGAGSFGSFAEKIPAWIVWIAFAGCLVAFFLWLRARRPAGRPEAAWTAISAAIVLAVALVLIFPVDIGTAIGAFSWTMGLLIAVAFALWVLLGYTTYGRYLHATGANPSAARLAGVRPGRETVKAFVLGGVLAALAGIALAANQGSAAPDVAVGFLLPAFAAAFLSTVILSTGHFTVWGTVIGGTFLVWVSQGLIVGGVPFTWTNVVNGLVLTLAVALSTIFRRRS